MKQKESNVTNAVMKWLKTIPHCVAKKNIGTWGNRGEPDIRCNYRGLSFFLEGKIPGNKLTMKQKDSLMAYHSAGGIVGVYHNLAEAQQIIYDGLKKNGISFDERLFTKIVHEKEEKKEEREPGE